MPREVNNLMRNAAILGAVDGRVSGADAREVLAMCALTEDGLTADMQAMLTQLYSKGRRDVGGEVRYQASLATIATLIGKSRDSKAVQLRVEPWLIDRGYVQVLHGGRALTDAGVERARRAGPRGGVMGNGVCHACNQGMALGVGCTVDGGRIRWGSETLLANRVQFAAQRGIEDPFDNPVAMNDPEADEFFRLCHSGPFATRPCPDCAVNVGQLHHPGCDAEECPDCHLQAIGCGCGGLERALASTGVTPGALPVSASQFARLSVTLGHDRAELEQTLRERFPTATRWRRSIGRSPGERSSTGVRHDRSAQHAGQARHLLVRMRYERIDIEKQVARGFQTAPVGDVAARAIARLDQRGRPMRPSRSSPLGRRGQLRRRLGRRRPPPPGRAHCPKPELAEAWRKVGTRNGGTH